jgi:uncharacterized RDD family membrane protein YckC
LTNPRARTVTAERRGIPLADRGSRLAAWLLDLVLNALSYIAGIVAAVAADVEEDIVVLLAFVMLFYLPLWIYQAYLRATLGQTIGKRVVKIRIVSYDDGSNPGFWRAVGLRDLVPWIIGLVVGLLFWAIDNAFIFGRERRCVHDYMAATIVVRADLPPGLDAAEVFD